MYQITPKQLSFINKLMLTSDSHYLLTLRKSYLQNELRAKHFCMVVLHVLFTCTGERK